MSKTMTFADHLDARGLSPLDVAVMCNGNVSERTVRNIRNGHVPTRGTIVLLASGLDRSVAYIARLIDAGREA